MCPIFTVSVLWTFTTFTLNYYQRCNPSHKANWRSSALGPSELTTKYRTPTKQQNTGVKTALQRLWNKNCVLILKTNFLHVNFLQWIALLFWKSLAHLQGIVTIVLLTDFQMINIKTTQSIVIIIIIIILYLHVININSNVDIIYFGESCCIWSIHLPEHNNAELFLMTLWKEYLTLTLIYSRMIIVLAVPAVSIGYADELLKAN